MIVASLSIRLPSDAWIADVSSSHPEATFRLLSGVPSGRTAVELGEVRADDPVPAAHAVADHRATETFERLAVTDDRVLSTYETSDTALYEFLQDAALPPEFPVVVRDGWFDLDFTGKRETFDRLRANLDEAGRDYELRSLVSATGPDDLLTDRQREVVEVALRAGYFEVPRECTLSELASELGIDPSTASGVIRRAQERVMAWHLTGSDQRRTTRS